jgi:hypothetical protein
MRVPCPLSLALHPLFRSWSRPADMNETPSSASSPSDVLVTPGGEAAALAEELRSALASAPPKEVYREFIARNDAEIRRPELGTGHRIVTARTVIHTVLVAHWAAREQARFDYDRPFSVVALGGTGRGEVTPCSDLDFGFLFDDAVDGTNAFLVELQRQCIASRTFEREYGFGFKPLPYNLDDPAGLTGKDLNSFLDLHTIHGRDALAIRFRERIRETYDPFEHYLHVRGFWVNGWEKAAGMAESLEDFDIKNHALRLFLAGVWTLAGREFRHSHEIYGTLAARDLEAYYFLLRIRCFIHSRKAGKGGAAAPGNHAEDLFQLEDFTSFGELLGPEATEVEAYEFANGVRARLLAARRRVARFARSVIAGEVTPGRRVAPGSPIVHRVAGLTHDPIAPEAGGVARSRAAMSLLLASQRYQVPIDPAELQATFREAGDWLELVPELAALFYERRGSLAGSLEFLAQFEGALGRLFPGHDRFETSIDARVSEQRQWLRGALERRKLQKLEDLIQEGQVLITQAVSSERLTNLADGIDPRVQAALLSFDHLAAVRLALKTKRLPVTPEDHALRADTRRPLHERLASGMSDIPLAEYFEPFRARAEFSDETLRMTVFLIQERRAFKTLVDEGPTHDDKVTGFAKTCGNEHALRALYVFTCSDRSEWESPEQEPDRWFLIDELYLKTMRWFRRGTDAADQLRDAGFSREELVVLQDFGPDFFGGIYRPHAITFGSHLLRLVEEPTTAPPKALLLRTGTSRVVGVAAHDFRGLAACITGEFWHQKVILQQAHLFSAMHHGLALDFFHLAPTQESLPPTLLRGIERAIHERRHIADADEGALPGLHRGRTSIQEWRNGLFLLRHETTQDASGLVYTLAYKVFRHLGGNIFGLRARTTRHGAFVSVYLGLPRETTLDAARRAVEERFV